MAIHVVETVDLPLYQLRVRRRRLGRAFGRLLLRLFLVALVAHLAIYGVAA